MSRCCTSLCLTLLLLLVPLSPSQAQLPDIEGWEEWNAASEPRFPGEAWLAYATPEDAGFSSEGIAAAKRVSKATGSAAVMVVYDGAVLAQWGAVSRRFKCHSIRKSLLSALYGIAVANDAVDIDASIGSVGIDDDRALTESEKTAKISDLLKSRSGVYLPAAYETRSMKDARPTRGSYEPGTHWYYNNWDFNVLATIYNRKTAGDVFEAFQTHLAEPLQMQDFDLRHTYYHLEPRNSRHPAYPFRMSARDLARFGLLYLNEGRWGSEQIVPAEWVRESTQAYSKHTYGGYGYMWWTTRGLLKDLGAYLASGYGGHQVYVVPGARLVVVHRANTYGSKRIEPRSIWNIVMQVLKARTGSPKANPSLVPLPAPPPRDPGFPLTKEQSAALIGTYQQKKGTARVFLTEDRLEIESPHYGRFFLHPRSPTEFLVEDAELRLEFDLDSRGQAGSLRIWFEPDDPFKMVRMQ